MLAFISEAGITTINEWVSDPNIVTIYQNFAELLAPTIFLFGYPAAWGVTGTQTGSGAHASVAVYGVGDTVVSYIAWTRANDEDSFTFPQLGHWLVRLAVLDPVIEVPFDVIPRALNVKKEGVLPVVIHSSGDIDVTTIDPESLLLEGVGRKILTVFSSIVTWIKKVSLASNSLPKIFSP